MIAWLARNFGLEILTLRQMAGSDTLLHDGS